MIKTRKNALLCFLVLFYSALAPGSLFAQDVLRFRGPDGNSFYTDRAFNSGALARGAKILWQASLNKGYSGVAVKGDRLFTMGNDRRNDTVYCLNAESGRVIWTYSYPCGTNEHPGPRATPVIDGNTVYTLSLEGHLFAFAVDNGAVKWKKDLQREFGARLPGWALAGSPVVVDELLIVNANRAGIAFNKRSGALIWSSAAAAAGYATPVVFTIGGQKYGAFFGESALYGVDLANGGIVWRHPWTTPNAVNAADPLVFGNRIFISTGYGRGCALLEFSATGIRLLWENKNLASHFTTPVYVNGYIYGITGNSGSGNFRVLDAGTGAIKLDQRVKFGSFIVVNGKFVIIYERGDLVIADITPTSYTELSAASLKRGTYWTAPVISRGRLYVRNEAGDLFCIDVR